MVGLTLVMVAVAIAVGFLASRVSAAIGRDLRRETFSAVIGFSHAEIEQFSTASLITRSTNDIQQVQFVCVILLRMVAYAPILGIGGIVHVARSDTGLTWITFLAVAALLILIGVLMKIAMPKFKLMQTLVDRLNLVSREILTGIMPVRAFSREKFEEQRFDVANRELMQTQLFTNRTMAGMMPFMTLIMNGTSLLIVWFGGKAMDVGTMQVGEMIAFITYTMQIVMSFLMLAMVAVMLPRAGVAADRIDEVLHTPATIHDPAPEVAEKTLQRKKWPGVVRFENVSFRYPGADDDALEQISFTALPGQTTAIIGSTGCGKSTLLNLISRFYDATGGRVTIDGVDVRDMPQHTLHDLLGYVPQKGVLFSGTIDSNLKFGGPQITDEDVHTAADIAQATEFIQAKPEGFQSPIAQGGTNVSGGQKQRLSIARAIAKHPRIYLFDDSFSALDYKTDVALRRALKTQTGDATVAIVGSIFAAGGIIAIGDIQAFIQYVKNFTQPIQQLSQVSNMLQSMAAAAERVFEFLAEEEEDQTADPARRADPATIDGQVTFDHVKFGYTPDKTIIHNFSCTVQPGQKVAIVGPTGAGKTTMVKLLMRFYDVDSGSITLNGHNVRDFDRTALREGFGMVLQDTWLFKGTIMENIRYGRLDATDEEVIAAAKAAGADHFIRTLPGGYQMELNEDASNVSQGQKQLLTIARTILADNRILVLDEATSSVDTRTEQRIQAAMDRLMQGRTSFIIAHRLSTIRNADLILVMRDGDIVEQGTHDELMEAGGFYADLYNSQFEDVTV